MMKRFVVQINKRIEVVQLYHTQRHSFSELTFETYFSTRIQVVHFVFVTTNNGMLSPDNFVQDATSTQGYNRFAYANNNPLKYTDPSGGVYLFDSGCCNWSMVGIAYSYGSRHWNVAGRQ